MEKDLLVNTVGDILGTTIAPKEYLSAVDVDIVLTATINSLKHSLEGSSDSGFDKIQYGLLISKHIKSQIDRLRKHQCP